MTAGAPTVTVRIPTPLRAYTGGADELRVSGRTVGEILASLGETHAGLRERVLDERGAVRGFVNLFLDSRNIERLQGAATPVSEGAILSIIPAVAGGAVAGGRP